MSATNTPVTSSEAQQTAPPHAGGESGDAPSTFAQPPRGRFGSLAADTIAGLSIAGLLLPEAVAYSGIAGLPPQTGVIALFAGLLCYGLIGRNPAAIVSATSSSAALLLATASQLQPGAHLLAVASMLVILAGLCFLAAAALRLGALSNFVARPVLRGYAFGLAAIIAVHQLPHAFGIGAGQGNFIPYTFELLQRFGQIHPASAATAIVAFAVLALCERWPRLPGSAVAIVLSVAVAPWLAALGVHQVGPIAFSLQFGMPAWPQSGQWLPSIELASALLLILYAESYSSINSAALRLNAGVQPNRDLLALGLANLVSGALQGLPVGAGYSATSANLSAGAQSRKAGLIAAAAVAALLLVALPWVERIPVPVLAAIVIHAVSKAWRRSVFAPYWRWHRDRLLILAAAIAPLLFGALNGLLLAIAASIVLMLRRFARPQLSELGRLVGNGHDFVSLATHPQAQQIEGIMVLRADEPLFFGNAQPILHLVRDRIEALPATARPWAVLLSLEESPDLDGTALEALQELAEWLQRHGMRLRFARLKHSARTVLERAGLSIAGDRGDTLSVDDAVHALQAEKA